MDAACAVCQEAFSDPPPPTSMKLSSGERVCGHATCRELVVPCTYCKWTGIGHQPVCECTGCAEAICQLCEEEFSNNTRDRADRVCEHAEYNDEEQ